MHKSGTTLLPDSESRGQDGLLVTTAASGYTEHGRRPSGVHAHANRVTVRSFSKCLFKIIIKTPSHTPHTLHEGPGVSYLRPASGVIAGREGSGEVGHDAGCPAGILHHKHRRCAMYEAC